MVKSDFRTCRNPGYSKTPIPAAPLPASMPPAIRIRIYIIIFCPTPSTSRRPREMRYLYCASSTSAFACVKSCAASFSIWLICISSNPRYSSISLSTKAAFLSWTRRCPLSSLPLARRIAAPNKAAAKTTTMLYSLATAKRVSTEKQNRMICFRTYRRR